MRVVDGREFECIKCGKCCKWEGNVVLIPKDIKRLSGLENMGEEEFLTKFTKKHNGKIVLKDKPGSKDCIYLKNNRCTVWDHKPKQCADYPKEYDERCPGFSDKKGSPKMSNKFAQAIKEVKNKLSNSNNYEGALTNKIYRDLDQNIKASSVTSVATGEGIDSYLEDNNTIKVANLDDLFSFDRISSEHLIHKCTRDLWKIDQDKEGNVQITRLFDGTGDPIKG